MFRSFEVERTLEGSCIYLGMITYSNWVGLIVDLGPVPKVLAPISPKRPFVVDAANGRNEPNL